MKSLSIHHVTGIRVETRNHQLENMGPFTVQKFFIMDTSGHEFEISCFMERSASEPVAESEADNVVSLEQWRNSHA